MALFGVGLMQLDRVEAQLRKLTVDFLNERLKKYPNRLALLRLNI